ncbi:hypothetical protein PGT21_027234 [Puccinia graminis f. sp. tritici]|uniref:Uncharacterized protein n=1 Tax=Puccinia graminis f. sp. tritici TaxID=56615 RepID=A0A5B0M5G6_PUCGR|nr:hypothetical protein PGT21_027234 [Puccinia graminis f. sp. tritici]KAA1135193.1 hypothetical protein PGTUg99_010706 [Puccinia graminis f. sp. tritici]
MQILSGFPFITLLVFFPFIIHARPKIALPNDYIIKSKGDHCQIFSADGKVAYQYAPELNTPSSGETSMTIKDGSTKKLFTLVSNHDICAYRKETFTQRDGPPQKDNLPQREFQFDPEFFSADVWRFNFIDNSGLRQHFRLKLGITDEGGKIHRVVSGKHDELVGKIKNQKRNDSWLNDPKGVDTVTLSCVDGAPVDELVTLLSLVFYKSHHCPI